MKKKYILLSLLFSSSLYAADIQIKQFKHTGPIALSAPIMTDSLNVNRKQFDLKELLKTNISFEKAFNSPSLTEADSNGMVSLQNAGKGYSMHLLSFYLNSDRFCKGQLKVKGNGTFQVYVDGKEVNAESNLNLEPRRYEVVIKYLADQSLSHPELNVIYDTASDAIVEATTNPEKRYTLTDVMTGKDVAGASLSPNGQYALISYVNRFEGGESEYWGQLRTADGKVLMQSKELVGAAWMPKSNAYYFTRKGMKGRELVSVNPVDHKETILANHIPEGSFFMSPDEKNLFYMVQENGPQEDKEIKRIIEPEDRIPGFRNRSFIWKYNLESGLYQQLTFGHHTTAINDISQDGKLMLFSTTSNGYTSLPLSRTSLYCLNLETMTAETIWEDAAYRNAALFSPQGDELLVFGTGDSFGGIGRNVKKGQTVNSFDGQLFIYNLKTKKARPLTKDFNPNVSTAVWSKSDGQIYLQGEDEDCVRIFKCNPKNGEISRLNLPEEVIARFALAEKAPVMLSYGQSASNANRLYTYHLDKDKAILIDDLSAEKLKDVKLGEVHQWDFKSADGTRIQGRYYLPPHFDPNKKYPLIVNYYGGTSPTSRNMEGRYATHMYAAQGYVVYIVNPSGTTGFGQEFSARHVNAWGDKTADEIIRGTELFCKEHPFVDKTKIGCIGASYGGFMTQYLQTKSNLFAAAISHAGISALSSYWGEGYWGYSYCSIANANTYPWSNPDFFTQHSPLFHADKINTPLLLIHGNADTNVPVGESIQMFAAMKILGKEVELIEVEGQDHHIIDYSKRTKWQNTLFAWFAKWLKGQPEWWDELYPKRNL